LNDANIRIYTGLGNIQRNAITGPGYADLDMSGEKDTKLTERLSFNLRVDAFDILNHPNFRTAFRECSIVDIRSSILNPLRSERWRIFASAANQREVRILRVSQVHTLNQGRRRTVYLR